MDIIVKGLLDKKISSVATGFDHATRTGDNTFSVYFVDGSKVDLTIPLPEDGKDGTTYEQTVGGTTTLQAGSAATASVTVSGNKAIYNFGIPQGIKGEKGDKGDTGSQGVQGEQGIQGQQGEKGNDGYPFLIYKQYNSIDEFNASDFPEIGLMFMVMVEDYDGDDALGYPIYRYTGNGEYSLVTHMNTSTATKGAKGDKGDAGITYTPVIGTVQTLNAGSNATASVSVDGTNAVYNFGIPKGKDANQVYESQKITLDTLIGGTETSPYHGDADKIVSSEYAYSVFADILPKVNAKIQSMFNLASNINYFTVNTYADLLAYDVSGLSHGINLFLVKQDENYPREGAADQYYSTIYIHNPVGGVSKFDLVGKLNVSEQMIETNMTRAITKALFNIDESGTPTSSKYLPRTEYSKYSITDLHTSYISAGSTVTIADFDDYDEFEVDCTWNSYHFVTRTSRAILETKATQVSGFYSCLCKWNWTGTGFKVTSAENGCSICRIRGIKY